MEALFIFIVWFIIGLFVGTYLAKKRLRPTWSIADEVNWWINLLTSSHRG